MSTPAANPQHRLLEIVRSQLARRPASLGRCPSCGAAVRPAEDHLRLRGDVFHERCARYAGRGPGL